MKEVKRIKYVGFWGDLDPEKFLISRILSEKYSLEETESPDYVICSAFGRPYSYCKYDAVRIFYSGENFAPDFNLVDYAVGSDDIVFGDRYHRFSDAFSPELAANKRGMTREELAQKEYFANFIVGHESEHNIRGDFFKLLSSKYKRVESAGSYLNNMPDRMSVTRKEKDAFVRKCKFTLCFESTRYPDFTTEKIIDAFMGNTVPVYFGNPNILRIFNPESFVLVRDRNDFERAIQQIIYLDTHDEAYLEMMSQPVYVKPSLVDDEMEGLRSFLFHIFDQPLDKSRRRSEVYMPKAYDRMLYTHFNERRPKVRFSLSGIKSKIAEMFPEIYRRYHVDKYGVK